MSDEKTRKLDTLAKLFHVIEKYNYMLTRLSDNLLKLEHHADLKTEQMNYENLPQQL